MAILCLARDLDDLKRRCGNIIVGYTDTGMPVYAHQLRAAGAMTALLKEALKPNLVQTLAGTPTFVHGGPFANIAHGCNSLIATKTALGSADVVVTEAGFGSDLGAEKFIDIKCRAGQIYPDAAVLVVTLKSVEHNSTAAASNSADSPQEGATAQFDIGNLQRHATNLRDNFGLPVVIAINRFANDSGAALAALKQQCLDLGFAAEIVDPYGAGAAGCLNLADQVLKLSGAENRAVAKRTAANHDQINSAVASTQAAQKREGAQPSKRHRFVYEDADNLTTKLRKVASKVYGAKDIFLSKECQAQIAHIEELGGATLPVCIAKTPFGFTDDPKRLGAPNDFNITFKAVKLCAGAEFVVAYAGGVMTMPGLPKHPNAQNIDVDADGHITGIR
jgi:formate--tetrahydrofolate ligase